MTISKTRDFAFKLIYELEVRKVDASEILDVFFANNKVSGSQKRYIEKIVLGAWEERQQLEDEISKYLRNWALNRISKISLAGLKLAIFEMNNSEDITPAIAISEAVNLVARYEGEEGANFVNGVLGEYSRRNEV